MLTGVILGELPTFVRSLDDTTSTHTTLPQFNSHGEFFMEQDAQLIIDLAERPSITYSLEPSSYLSSPGNVVGFDFDTTFFDVSLFLLIYRFALQNTTHVKT